jgi:hypothetical protein
MLFAFNELNLKAQEQTKNQVVFYSVFVNVVPDNFNYPLVGFINVARGDYKGLELSFVNTTIGDFKGFQLGFINTTLKEQKGVQIGFINSVLGDFKGVQTGFINSSLKQTKGLQFGFMNTALKGIKGYQIGFINYAENVEFGIPIGFLSIVRDGGYRALELSFNELFPFNLTFKTGVPKFYTLFKATYNSKIDAFGVGFGAGTMIPLTQKFWFNPELEFISAIYREKVLGGIETKNFTATSFAANFRYNLTQRLQIGIAPAVSLTENTCEPFYSFIQTDISNRKLVFGLRASLTWNFTTLQ